MTGVAASLRWLRVVGQEGDFEWLLSELRESRDPEAEPSRECVLQDCARPEA